MEDMLFKTMTEKNAEYLKYDIDSMYNMQDVNNTQSIGYDNLDKKDGTYENSHSDVFDKLLADYYLSQRGEYAESNKLMAQLTSVFDGKVAKKKHVRDQNVSENIHSYKLEQDMDKADAP